MESPHPRPAPMNLNVNMDVRAPSPLPTRASQFLRKITAVRIPLSMSRKTTKSNSGPNNPYPSVRQASAADARAGAKPYMSQPMLSLPGESDSPCEQNDDARSMSSGDDEHSPGTSQGKGSMDADGESNRAHLQARTQSMPGHMRSAAGQTHKKSPSAPLVPATTAPKIVVSPGEVPPVPEKDSGPEADRNSDKGDNPPNRTASEKGKAVASLGGESRRSSSSVQNDRRNSSASAHPIALQPGARRHSTALIESSSGASVSGNTSSSHPSVAESHSHPPPRAPSPPSSIRRTETLSSQSFTSALTSPGQEETPITSEQPPSPVITVPCTISPKNPFRPTSEAIFPSVSDIPPSPIIPAKQRSISESHPPTAFRPNAPISLPHFQSLPRPFTSNTRPPSLVSGTPSLSGLPPSFVSIPGTPSARLSPAIITRQPPHPILTLPPISPQHTRARSSTVVPGSSGASTSGSAILGAQRPGHGRGRSGSLRSMPALPREGPDDTRRDDHDDDEGSLEDLEEEESDEDEEQDEERERIRVSESGRSDSAFGMSDIDHDMEDDGEIQVEQRRSDERPWQIPMPELDVETSPLDMSFMDRLQRGTNPFANMLAAHAQQAEDKTPTATRRMDYFSSTAPTHESTPQTDKLPPRPPSKDSVKPARPQAASSRPSTGLTAHTVPMPPIGTPTLSPRPSMYHHTSRSLVDMASMIKERDRNRERTPEIAAREPVGLGAATPKSNQKGPSAPSVASEQDGILGASLRRQHSMPTFGPSTEPPPYPAFPNRPSVVIQPRDEEGREPLPAYTNHIYLRTVMPRKMEFTAPGVQARDRKWRRTLCVLEGTAFRVYRCSKGAGGVGVLSEWWERRVGVGDITEEPRTVTARGPRARRSEGGPRDPARAERDSAREQREREREAARAAKEGENGEQSTELLSPPTRTPPTPTDAPQPIPVPSPVPPPPTTKSKLLPSRFLHASNASSGSSSTPSSPTRSRFLSDSSPRNTSAMSAPTTGRRSLSGLRPSLIGGSGSNSNTSASPSPSVISTRTRRGVVPSTSTSSTAEASTRPRRNARDRGDSSSSSLWREDADAPTPAPEDLVKGYSLNNAESGLGSDYHKRKNVIRVRVDGEQFLLQAPDVAAVVDWIEGFQAAANIALDLDERPMPKGPMFPRRRRRRARRPDGQAAANASPNSGAASSSAGDNSSRRH